jgi:hypothetical protein
MSIATVLDIARVLALNPGAFRFTGSFMSDLRRPHSPHANFIPRGNAIDGNESKPGDGRIGDYPRVQLLRALECGAESLPAMRGVVAPRRR